MKRSLLTLFVCLAALLPAHARAKWNGFCQQGGVRVSMASLGTSTGKFMASYPGCTITVYNTGTSDKATIYSDSAGTPKSNPFTADSTTGFAGFYADNGLYDIHFSGTGFSTYTQAGWGIFDLAEASISGATITNSTIDSSVIGGNVPAAGTFTTLNAAAINSTEFTGSGATPAIDTAVTACSSNPCLSVIRPTYSGIESANLTMLSNGYRLYAGVNKITILDLRANVASPGSPADAPLYPLLYGGRLAGQIVRLGINGYNTGTLTDSTAGAALYNWLNNAVLPGNFGEQAGSISSLEVSGSITGIAGFSNGILAGADAEAHYNPTSADGTLPYLTGLTVASGITRANGAGNITTASGILASGMVNESTAGASIANAYGFDAEPQTVGTSRNYSYHSVGNWLTENGTQFDAVDSGGTPRLMVKFDSTNLVINRPLANAQGWSWQNLSGTQLLGLTGTTASISVPLTSSSTSGGAFLNLGATTSQRFFELANTGNAGFYYGIESSSSGGFFTGSNAYESVLYSPSNNLFVKTAIMRTSAAISIGTTIAVAGQVTSTLATGTAPLVIASTTPVANLTSVPTTYDAAGTQQTGVHVVKGNCTLGTSCAVTLVGSAVFTSISSYECSATDETSAAAVRFAPSSGSAFALTGTGTDVLSFHCVGN